MSYESLAKAILGKEIISEDKEHPQKQTSWLSLTG